MGFEINKGYNPEKELHTTKERKDIESQEKVKDIEAEEHKPKTPSILKKELLAAISHETNQPITTLVARISLLSKDVATPALESAAQKMYEFAHEVSSRGEIDIGVSEKRKEYPLVEELDKVAFLKEYIAEIVQKFRDLTVLYGQALAQVESSVDTSVTESDKDSLVEIRKGLDRLVSLIKMIENIQHYKIARYVGSTNMIDLPAASRPTQ